MNTKLEDTFNISTMTDANEENQELNQIEQSIKCVDNNKEIVKVNADTDNEKLETDFEISRSNLGIIVDKGTKSLETLAELADKSAQPEAFESLASMIRSLSEASKNLLNLHKQKSEVLNPQGNRPDLQVLVTTNMITKQLPSTARNRLLNKQDGELIEGEVENESE